MPTLKTRSKSQSIPLAEAAKDVAITSSARPGEAATALGPQDLQHAQPGATKPAQQPQQSQQPISQPVAAPAVALALPKAFLALAVDAGIFMIGSLPEGAARITALGYYTKGGEALMLCCVPAKGGILLVDEKSFVAPAGDDRETLAREQKYLAFLPVPAKLLVPGTVFHFAAVQEDETRTEFEIEILRLQTLDDALRESVIREYRHLFAPAVSAMLPPDHPLRAANKAAAAKGTAPATPTTPASAAAPQARPAPADAAKPAAPANTAAAASKARATPVRAVVPQQGFFDEIVDGRAEGWAFDPANPKQRLVVEILEGDRVVARGVADRFRDDLLNAGRGDGRYCYKLPVSYELRDGKPHQLTARVARTKQALQVKGGGPSHLFQHAPVDNSEFDLIPAAETVKLAAAIAGGLKEAERQKALAFAFSNANLALEMRELNDAARGFLDLMHEFGEQPLFFCKLAEAYLLGGRTQDALRTYQKAVESGPEFGWGWLGLAGAQRLLQAWTEAESAYRKCMELMPGFAPANARLANIQARRKKVRAQDLLKAGKRAEAIGALKDYLRHHLDDDEAFALLEQALLPEATGNEDPFANNDLQAFEAAQQLLDTVLDVAESMLETGK